MKRIILFFILLFTYSVLADQVEILDDADNIFRSKLDIIENAKPKSHVLISSFIYRNDSSSKMLLLAAMDAAKRGVKPYIIVDAPHLMLDPAYIKVAREAGVEFRLFNPMGLKSFEGHKRYHNKLTATGYLEEIKTIAPPDFLPEDYVTQSGGTNIGDEYHGMNKELVLNDRDARFRGKSTWDQVSKDFMKMWNSDWVVDANVEVLPDEEVKKYREQMRIKSEKMKWKLDLISKITPITLDTPDPTLGSGKQYITVKELEDARADLENVRKQLLELKIAKNWNQPAEWFKGSSDDAVVNVCTDVVGKKGKCAGSAEGIYDVIKSSKKTLTISTPYFLLTKRMKAALKDAVARGVKVTVVTNSLDSGDNLLTQKAYQYKLKEYAETGIDIYEYQGTQTLHAKNVQADGRSYTIGGYNFDNRSENLNTEIVLTVDNDAASAKNVQASIERDIKKSLLVASGGKVIVINPKHCGNLYEKLFMKMIEYQL